MDWNGNLRTFVPVTRPEASFDFVYSYNYDQYPGMEMNKHSTIAEKSIGNLIPAAGMEKNNIINYGSQEKKKRLTSDQLESLERSFQEEIKLDPDRKLKLSRELGLQPRQIAVWFQNRRARWKTKQLEFLYDALKQEFDVVSRDKQQLQEEVTKLKSMLREQAGTRNKQVSTGITEVSGEETVESTSVAVVRNSNAIKVRSVVNQHQIAECNYPSNIDGYNPAVVSSPFWGALPTYQSSLYSS